MIVFENGKRADINDMCMVFVVVMLEETTDSRSLVENSLVNSRLGELGVLSTVSELSPCIYQEESNSLCKWFYTKIIPR